MVPVSFEKAKSSLADASRLTTTMFRHRTLKQHVSLYLLSHVSESSEVLHVCLRQNQTVSYGQRGFSSPPNTSFAFVRNECGMNQVDLTHVPSVGVSCWERRRGEE